MKFLYYFYIIIFFLIKVKISEIQCSADFNVLELEQLSKKLNPKDCGKLLQELYLRTPAYEVNNNRKIKLEQSILNNQNCRQKLEEWNRKFPGKENKRARENMVQVLKLIGRSDLAKFIERSKRIIELLHNYVRPEANWRGHSDSSTLPKVKKKRKKLSDDSEHIKTVREHKQNVKEPVSAKADTIKRASDGESSVTHALEKISVTVWVAFALFVLLVLGATIAVLTVILCKNRARIWGSPLEVVKGCDDRCRLLQTAMMPAVMESGLIATPPGPSPRKRRRSSMSLLRRRFSSSNSIVEKKPKKSKTRREEKSRREKRSVQAERPRRRTKSKLEDDGISRKVVSNVLGKEMRDCTCCDCSKSGANGCSDERCREHKIDSLLELYPGHRRLSAKPSRIKDERKRKSKAKERRSTVDEAPRRSSLNQAFMRFKNRHSPRPSAAAAAEACGNVNCGARKASRDRVSIATPRDSEQRKVSF